MTKFEIVGKLVGCKETDNFHPYEVHDFDSGWQVTKYQFNVVSGTNRFMVEINGGCWKSANKNTIKTFSRATKDTKSKPIDIAWDKRNDPNEIKKVAGYKIFTCNLMDFEEQKTAEDALKDKKNHEFLSSVDYANFIKKVIDSGKYKDATFKIQGTYEFSYSEKTGLYYKNMVVNKIYKQVDGTDNKAEVVIDCCYTADSFDDESIDETNKSLFSCYTQQYFGKLPKEDKYNRNRFVPITLVVNGKKESESWKKLLTRFDEEPVRQISLLCDMIDGAPMETISYDDMDDSTKEMIDLGIITVEEAARDLGGNKIGQRVTEINIKKPGKRSIKGSEPTAYEVEDLMRKPIAEEEPVEEEEVEDLFGDDSDLDEDDI